MKIIDRQGRLFGLINIIDVLVVLLVVSALGFYVYKHKAVNPRLAPAAKTYTVRVLVQELRKVTVDELRPGLVVKEFDANVVMGTIRSVDAKPAVRNVQRADGTIVPSPIPDRYDVTLTIEAPAQTTDWSIRIANTEMRIGSTIKVTAQRFLVSCTVIGLEEKK